MISASECLNFARNTALGLFAWVQSPPPYKRSPIPCLHGTTPLPRRRSSPLSRRSQRRDRLTSCRKWRASPSSTMTVRCGPSIRYTPSSPLPSTGSRRWRRTIRNGRITQPFKAVLEGDLKTLAAAGEKGLLDIIMATHSGMTDDQFAKIVTDWLATAGTRGRASIPNSSTSRCWNCSPI